MANFKAINYGRMLYESLRNYFSVNYQGNISWLYKFCAACIQPLQAPFDAYAVARAKNHVIAQCRWQMGQLKNTLNFLYDATPARIYIDQSTLVVVSDPEFAYAPIHFDSTFADALQISERAFSDRASTTILKIHIPVSIDLSDATATIEQIKVSGISYQLITF